MGTLWAWAARNRLTVFIATTAGALLGAIITRSLEGAVMAVVVGGFLVVLSLVANRVLDWWEARRSASP